MQPRYGYYSQAIGEYDYTPPGLNSQRYPMQGFGTNGAAAPPPNRYARYIDSTTTMIYGAASLASAGICAYHGYRRNDSIGWAIWWGVMGSMFTIIPVGIALAQGYGKRSKR